MNKHEKQNLERMLARAHESRTPARLSAGLPHAIMADVRTAARSGPVKESVLDELERIFAPSLAAAAVTIVAAVYIWLDLSGALGSNILTLAGLVPGDVLTVGLQVP